MPKRKRSSWGCVQRVSTGVWRIRWWEDTADGRVRRSETFRGTRRQADDRLAQLRASQGGRYGGSPTLRAAYDAWWLPDAEGRVERGEYRERSLRQAKSIWGVHIEPRWGRVPVDKIKPLDVQEWLSTLTEQTAQKCKSLMRQVLDMCVMYEAVDSNPMDKRYRLPATKAPRDTAVYGLDGLRDVWEAVKGSPIEGAVILLAFGGCRVGEALGVMAEEVGLVDAGGIPVATAPIRRQVLNGTGEVSDSVHLAIFPPAAF